MIASRVFTDVLSRILCQRNSSVLAQIFNDIRDLITEEKKILLTSDNNPELRVYNKKLTNMNQFSLNMSKNI